MLDSPVFTMQTCRVYCRMAESLEQSSRVYSAVCERLRVYILLSSSSLHSDSRLSPVHTVQQDTLLSKTKTQQKQSANITKNMVRSSVRRAVKRALLFRYRSALPLPCSWRQPLRMATSAANLLLMRAGCFCPFSAQRVDLLVQ